MTIKFYIDNTVCHKFVEFYEKYYLDKSGLTFLDIGCGQNGPFSKYIADHKNKVVAVDIINELPCTERIFSIKADIFKIDFVPSSFDCVLDNCCLQLFSKEEIIELYKKIKKWLKPNGRFYTKTAAESPYYKRIKSRLSTADDITQMFKDFDIDYTLWSSPLMTGEVADHYIIDAIKRKD